MTVNLGGIVRSSGTSGYCFKIYHKDDKELQHIKRMIYSLLEKEYDIDMEEAYFDKKEDKP